MSDDANHPALCGCGKPVAQHESYSEGVRQFVNFRIAMLGRWALRTHVHSGRTFLVDRWWLALHDYSPEDLLTSGFEEVQKPQEVQSVQEGV